MMISVSVSHTLPIVLLILRSKKGSRMSWSKCRSSSPTTQISSWSSRTFYQMPCRFVSTTIDAMQCNSTKCNTIHRAAPARYQHNQHTPLNTILSLTIICFSISNRSKRRSVCIAPLESQRCVDEICWYNHDLSSMTLMTTIS